MNSLPNQRSRRRKAFTLVELLVVIAIIGVMIALLLPAVQAVREAARAVSCRSNLKQICLALHTYEAAKNSYPPSIAGAGWSAQARLLPYVEQGGLERLIDYDKSYNDAEGVKTTRLPLYLCPSEQNDVVRKKNGESVHYPLNYGFNMGDWFVYDPKTGHGGRGALRPYRATRQRDIKDGMSNTICAAEVKAYTPYYRDANKEASELELPEEPADIKELTSGAQGKLGPDLMQNTGHSEWVDGRTHQTGFTAVFTPNTKVLVEKDGKEYDVDWTNHREGKSGDQPTYAAVTSRSFHVGYVNIVMMDGSVHTVHDDIDLEVWRAMATRNGDEHVDFDF